MDVETILCISWDHIYHFECISVFYVPGLPEEEPPSTPKDHLLADKIKKNRQSQVSLLTRSWHSIDFKQHKSKSKESIRSRASRRNVDLNEVKVDA